MQEQVVLNIGCGWKKLVGGINVDAFAVCEPDVVWNLNDFPYPWEDNSVDKIFAYHVFEHLEKWWDAVEECARILKVGGELEIRVPDPSSDSCMTYRDHLNVIGLFSFDGIFNRTGGRGINAWAKSQDIVPLVLVRYAKVPFEQYNWMPKWMLNFCNKYLRNIIWEQRFLLKKIDVEIDEEKKWVFPKCEYHCLMTSKK